MDCTLHRSRYWRSVNLSEMVISIKKHPARDSVVFIDVPESVVSYFKATVRGRPSKLTLMCDFLFRWCREA